MVIGVRGKSSVKNMLLEELRAKRTKQPHIVEFNPWQLSGTGGITASFFHELGVALGQSGADSRCGEAGKSD